MAYNKSEIMIRANAFRKEGLNQSQALVKSWALAKAENIDNQLFVLGMADRHTESEKAIIAELRAESSRLHNKAKSIGRKVMTEEEKDEIRCLMELAWAKAFSVPGEVHLDEYCALEMRLMGKAA